MTLHTSARAERLAFHYGMTETWATGHNDGPPEDWDEIRARLRMLHQSGRGRRRQIATPRTLDGSSGSASHLAVSAVPPRLRVSWRPADVLVPAGVITLLTRLYPAAAPSAARRWWQQHNPLLVQRLLVVVSALLLLNLLVGAF